MKNLSKNKLALGIFLASFALISTVPATAQDTKESSPKQQLRDFYALCKQGKPADGLIAALSKSKSIKPADAQRVADAFAQMVKGMGTLVGFEIIKETPVSKRLVVLRCVAHFAEQPFVNEFTFYNPGGNEWRMIHLRYDANIATMFAPELR